MTDRDYQHSRILDVHRWSEHQEANLFVDEVYNKLKSKIINDFDKQLQTEFSTDLYDFIATVKSDEGGGFHETVDVINEIDGPQRLVEEVCG